MYRLQYLFLVVVLALGMLSVACSDDTTGEDAPVATFAPAEVSGEKIPIRWFVGLGSGVTPQQVVAQEKVVADFNASQDEIELTLEIALYDNARDTLAAQIASGIGPDIVGPIGWGEANDFYGEWLDLGPYIEAAGFDTAVFDPAQVASYQTTDGQIGLPFAVSPSALYYIPASFDQAGLAHPPQTYGDPYELDGELVEWNWATLTEVARRLTIDASGFNATEASFSPSRMVQVGFSPQWQTHPNYIGTYVAGAAPIVAGNAPGSYTLNYPASWKEAIRWYYDGMYGQRPFIPTGPVSTSPEFGNNNLFNTGKAAMAMTPFWYTCCLTDLRDAGVEFQLAVLPNGADGVPHGRVDADTFHIWQGTKNPAAAFTVLTYLLTTGTDTLLPTYDALPAILVKQAAYFARKAADYPFVTSQSWGVFKAGLTYPDTPSAEQFQPNWNEAWARQQTFLNLLNNTSAASLDFDAEWQKMVDDVNVIYNKPSARQ